MDPAGSRSSVDDTPFSMKVDRRDSGIVVLLNGSCTMNVARELGDKVRALASEAPRRIVLEMSAVDFIESTCLGGLVSGYSRLRRHGGELRIVSPTPEIARLLRLTRLEQLFQVYDSIDNALQ